MNIKTYKRGQDIKLSANFHLSEFECKCSYADCVDVIVDMDHITKLQQLRDGVKKSISISSGHRCLKHNKDEDGVDESQHPKGTATDIKVSGMFPAIVQEKCEHFDGLGRYKTFTHIDSRGYKARWGTTPDIPEAKAKPEYLPDGPSDEEINGKLSDIEKLIKSLLGKA